MGGHLVLARPRFGALRRTSAAHTAGNGALHPPRTSYSEHAPGGFISLWILAEALPFPLHAPTVIDLSADRRFPHAVRFLLEEFRGQSSGWQAACATALAAVLRCLHHRRGVRSGDFAVDAVIEILQQQAEDPLCTPALAMRRVGASPTSLRRRFREAMGMTPTRFLAGLRIDHARQLLSLSDLSIAAIAERVGFVDRFYFSRIFHQRVGQSPRRYRQSTARV